MAGHAEQSAPGAAGNGQATHEAQWCMSSVVGSLLSAFPLLLSHDSANGSHGTSLPDALHAPGSISCCGAATTCGRHAGSSKSSPSAGKKVSASHAVVFMPERRPAFAIKGSGAFEEALPARPRLGSRASTPPGNPPSTMAAPASTDAMPDLGSGNLESLQIPSRRRGLVGMPALENLSWSIDPATWQSPAEPGAGRLPHSPLASSGKPPRQEVRRSFGSRICNDRNIADIDAQRPRALRARTQRAPQAVEQAPCAMTVSDTIRYLRTPQASPLKADENGSLQQAVGGTPPPPSSEGKSDWIVLGATPYPRSISPPPSFSEGKDDWIVLGATPQMSIYAR